MNICIELPEWAWITLASILGAFLYPLCGAILAGKMQQWGYFGQADSEGDAFVAAFFWPFFLSYLIVTWPARTAYRYLTR